MDLATAGQLGTALERGSQQAATLVADLTQVGFCDASGLRALLAASARGRECGAPLRIVASSPVRWLIELAGARETLEVYGDLRQALPGAPDPAPG